MVQPGSFAVPRSTISPLLLCDLALRDGEASRVIVTRLAALVEQACYQKGWQPPENRFNLRRKYVLV